MYSDEEKTSLWLTADERVIRSRSPPAFARSDGNMLLRTTVAVLSPWKMVSCLIQLDIYLNKVQRSVFHEGHVCKHPTHCDTKNPNKVNSQIWQDLLTSSYISSLHFTINCTFILEMWRNHRKENGDSSETQRRPDELTSTVSSKCELDQFIYLFPATLLVIA